MNNMQDTTAVHYVQLYMLLWIMCLFVCFTSCIFNFTVFLNAFLNYRITVLVHILVHMRLAKSIYNDNDKLDATTRHYYAICSWPNMENTLLGNFMEFDENVHVYSKVHVVQ